MLNAVNLAVAALAGLAVGIEREWSGHASGPNARFAGVRTFLLLGLVGGVAGSLLEGGAELVAGVLLATGGALTVAAYVMASRRGNEAVDGTTEAAALAVLAIATLAGTGELRVAGGAAAVMVLALREKSQIHSIVARIDDLEMRAAVQFAVLALVILPLLPEGPFGPYGGIEPRKLWVIVLILSGISFVGYLARRLVGESRGYGVAGLLGGVVSSTGVTLSFSRLSRDHAALGGPLALGVVGASTVLLLRVLVVTLALNPALPLPLLPLLVPPFIVGAVIVTVSFLRSTRKPVPKGEGDSHNPLRLGSALGMASGFQVVLMGVAFVRERFGDAGILPTAALLGFTDMDALTLAMTRLGHSGDVLHLAARAIAIGILSNTVLKLGISLTVGRGRFRRDATLGLLALGTGSLAGLWLFW